MCSAHWERRRVGRAYCVQWRLLASLVAACHDGLTVRASAEDACTLAEVKEEMVVLVRPSRTIPLS